MDAISARLDVACGSRDENSRQVIFREVQERIYVSLRLQTQKYISLKENGAMALANSLDCRVSWSRSLDPRIPSKPSRSRIKLFQSTYPAIRIAPDCIVRPILSRPARITGCNRSFFVFLAIIGPCSMIISGTILAAWNRFTYRWGSLVTKRQSENKRDISACSSRNRLRVALWSQVTLGCLLSTYLNTVWTVTDRVELVPVIVICSRLAYGTYISASGRPSAPQEDLVGTALRRSTRTNAWIINNQS